MRGVTCDVVEGDEASFNVPHLYDEVRTPLFQMDHVTAIFISTMMGCDNYYSKIFERMHPVTGKPMFRQIKITLVCNKKQCLKNPTRCWHKVHHIPYWQSVAKHVLCRQLIESETVAARELTGMVMDQGIKVFERPGIDIMFTTFAGNLNNYGTVKFAMTSVDPNNDGASDYALVTVLYTTKMNVVRFVLFFVCYFIYLFFYN